MFTYHKDTDCTIIFKNIRFDVSAGVSFDIFSDIVGGSGASLLTMTFDYCDFTRVRAIDNTALGAGLAWGNKNLKHCSGSLTNVIRSTHVGGFGGLVVIEDCYLSWDGRLNQLGDYAGAWSQDWVIRGGMHWVTGGPWFTWGNTVWGRFHDLSIVFTASGGELFNQGPSKYVGQGAIFQNIYVETNRVDNRLIYFDAFAFLRTDEIVIDGFHGRALSTVGTPVPMIEIADVANTPPVNLGLISCDGNWSACYVGPPSSGSALTHPFTLMAGIELTIVEAAGLGAVTVTQAHHTIDTEGDIASDDLNTINGLVANQLYFFYPADDARTVVFKHGTDNILCIGNADITLDDVHDFLWGFSPDGATIYVGWPVGAAAPGVGGSISKQWAHAIGVR
jgi:hypothetical protein